MKYKTAFRLALRAIGILVLAQNLPWAAVGCGSVALRRLLPGVGPSSWFLFDLNYILIHTFGVVLGLYLFFGGRWIVNRAIPSNRPYCHECGYELTGLPTEGLCPECGTAFRRPGANTTESV